MRYSSPSPMFPALTAVSIEVPDTWTPDMGGDAAMLFFDPDAPAHFRTNVTVNVKRVVAGPTVDVFAQKFVQESSGSDEFTPLGNEVVDLGGHRAVLQLHTFVPPGYPLPVFQAQCLVVVPTEAANAADLVEVHASCAGDQADRYAATFRGIINSLEMAR